ncbi:MAG: cyclic nucleotide-binding domain-containing protein [Wenzhouxiangella sp.]|nr:MAG: cyclic nucleotide-binding domain-containing protein [Wenzhouxiangella sp.]
MNADDISRYLAEHELFSGLDDQQLAFLAANGEEKHFDDGEIVSRQGQAADRFYIVLEGGLTVQVPAIAGPTLEVTRLSVDQVLGWSWLIEPYRWHFNALATGRTRALEFDGKAILARCEEDSAFGYALFKRFSALMGKRLEAAQRKMMDQWSPAGFA